MLLVKNLHKPDVPFTVHYSFGSIGNRKCGVTASLVLTQYGQSSHDNYPYSLELSSHDETFMFLRIGMNESVDEVVARAVPYIRDFEDIKNTKFLCDEQSVNG